MRRSPLFAAILVTACTGSSSPAPSPASISHVAQQSNTSALLIAVSAVSDSVAWASGSGGTWVRTVDGGNTWQAGMVPGADSLQFRDVHALDANHAWLLSIGNGPSSRVYYTADGGTNWTLQFTNQDPDAFYDCFGFWDAQRAIAVGDAVKGHTGILTTDDGGAHWNPTPAATTPTAPDGEGSYAASGTCLQTWPGGRVWIVAADSIRSRVIFSGDYGRTWGSITLPLTSRAGTGAASIAFVDGKHGMALGGGTTAKPGDENIAVTSDSGFTWTLRSKLPLKTGAWGGVYVPGAKKPTVVAVGPGGSAWSADNGATWVMIDTLNYWSVGFASPRAGWAVGTRGKITKLGGF
jgi:photosystem II stability/assembly factor-like uncharacterized protein